MKKRMAALVIGILFLLTGCAAKKEEQTKPVPTVKIEHGSYQYDHGYSLAEGWMFDMTISSEKQIAELNALAESIRLELTGDDFLMDSGYRLVWYDAAGEITREMLILSRNEASMDGMMYDMNGADGLIGWLDALRLDEQNVTE